MYNNIERSSLVYIRQDTRFSILINSIIRIIRFVTVFVDRLLKIYYFIRLEILYDLHRITVRLTHIFTKFVYVFHHCSVRIENSDRLISKRSHIHKCPMNSSVHIIAIRFLAFIKYYYRQLLISIIMTISSIRVMMNKFVKYVCTRLEDRITTLSSKSVWQQTAFRTNVITGTIV